MDEKNGLNVLLVTADSLRSDFLGCYSDDTKDSLTPNIDIFAKEGFLFENFYSQGNRTPVSFPAILSGQYAYRYGFSKKLHESRPLIQEILKKNNYFTSAIHSNPYISKEFNYDRGFNYYEENIKTFESTIFNKKFRNYLRRLDILLNGPYKTGEAINKQLKSFVNKKKQQQQFIWMHYMDTHGPYIKKSGIKQLNLLNGNLLWKKALSKPSQISKKEHSNIVDLYKTEVRYFDRCFKELLSIIDIDQTIIILSADHGELLGENGLYGHDHNHYEPLFAVPLIIKLPRKYFHQEPKRIGALAQSIDICPTILDLLDIDIETNFDGDSLVKFMFKDNHKERDCIIHEIQKGYYCIRKDNFKYVRCDRYDKKFECLYNLANDPSENENIYFQNEDSFEVQIMKEKLDRHINKISGNIDNYSNSDDVGVSDNIKERLKALGYFE